MGRRTGRAWKGADALSEHAPNDVPNAAPYSAPKYAPALANDDAPENAPDGPPAWFPIGLKHWVRKWLIRVGHVIRLGGHIRISLSAFALYV